MSSVYLEEDAEVMSVKQRCKEILYSNISGMTRFKFIKKDGKKLTDATDVIKLIQDIKALDNICHKVLWEDEEHKGTKDEKHNASHNKSVNKGDEDKSGSSNGNGKSTNEESDGGNHSDKPCGHPRCDHKWKDCPNNTQKKDKKEKGKDSDDKKEYTGVQHDGKPMICLLW